MCKKQKICAVKITECIDALIQEISAAQQQLTSDSDVAAVMQQLSQRCSKPEVLKELSDSTKDLHSAVNKLGKVTSPARISWMAGRSGTSSFYCRGSLGYTRCEPSLTARTA